VFEKYWVSDIFGPKSYIKEYFLKANWFHVDKIKKRPFSEVFFLELDHDEYIKENVNFTLTSIMYKLPQ
jgi:hypothetical protein